MRDLSVVIPAYNEAARIGETLESIAAFLDERNRDDEVIIVDDGSKDDTVVTIEYYRNLFRRLRVVQSWRNHGKGHAVRQGMLTATGALRLFVDADNSTDIREFNKLMAAANAERVTPAVIIGSVAVSGADVTTKQPGMRASLGRLGNQFIQRAVLPGIEDTQRGFKVFTAEATEAIFSRCTSDGWVFDVEALAFARALGYPILEVPITWEHREDSRVRASAYASSLVDVLKIKRRVEREATAQVVTALPSKDAGSPPLASEDAAA